MGEETDSLAETLRGHVIICGLGHVGYRCVELLDRLGERGVAISRHGNDQWLLPAECGFAVLVGDARNEHLLRKAGIERAKAVLVVTDDDLTNVSIALDARRLNPQAAVIVRLFDLALAGHLEKSIQVRRVLSTSALAAPQFVAAAIGQSAQCAFEVGSQSCIATEQAIGPGSEDAGLTAGQWSRLRHAAVLAMRRGDCVMAPPGDSEKLQAGDRLTTLGFADHGHTPSAGATARPLGGGNRFRRLGAWCGEAWRDTPVSIRTALGLLGAVVCLSVIVFQFALGISTVDSLYFVITTITTVGYGDYNLMNASAGMKIYGAFLMLCGAALMATFYSIVTDLILRKRLRDLLGRSHARRAGHIVIAGLGSIGFRLATELSHRGESVVAIEQNKDNPFLAATRELAGVVVGNARTDESLRRAGLEGAKALLAVTDDDLVNLSIALAVKQTRPSCRVVLRLFDSQLADKMRSSLNVDSVLSVSSAAAPTLVGSALCDGVLHGLVLPDCLVLLRRTDGKELPGEPSNKDVPLFVKRAGAAGYSPCDQGDGFGHGDEIIVARWLPLAKSRCGR